MEGTYIIYPTKFNYVALPEYYTKLKIFYLVVSRYSGRNFTYFLATDFKTSLTMLVYFNCRIFGTTHKIIFSKPRQIFQF